MDTLWTVASRLAFIALILAAAAAAGDYAASQYQRGWADGYDAAFVPSGDDEPEAEA